MGNKSGKTSQSRFSRKNMRYNERSIPEWESESILIKDMKVSQVITCEHTDTF